VAIFTNDYRGWRILATASVMLDDNHVAFDALKRAVTLGDQTCYVPLAATALKLNRVETVRDMLPNLLKIKKSTGPPKFVKMDVVAVLTTYSLKTGEKDVFMRAISGELVEDILERDDVTACVSKACKSFEVPELDQFCRELHEAAQRLETEKKK
jgi:hypothetical protein